LQEGIDDEQQQHPFVVNPAQAAVLGLARVIEAELPELDCVCVDLDPNMEAMEKSKEAKALLEEVLLRKEQLRKEYSDIVFVIGTEFSLDIKGFIQGDTIYERISRMFKPASLIKNALGFGIRKELNNFLSKAVLAARQNFKGDVTYSAGHWEKINWDLFDIVSVNYYRNKFNASRYRDYIKKFVNTGKRTAITEFGCCSYIGADQKGAWGYSVIDRSSPVPKLNAPYERDENVQAKYITDLLKIFSEENVFAAFVFNFIVPNAPYNKVPIYDLDMANFGIVKVLPGKNTGTDEPYIWERKKAFYELSKFYSGY
jgi:hypothetical protein